MKELPLPSESVSILSTTESIELVGCMVFFSFSHRAPD